MRPSSEVVDKFRRYILTGGTAAVVDWAIFTSLHALGVPAVAATTCSFLIAAVVNYSLCCLLVFHRPLSLRGFFLFLSGAALGYCINTTVTLSAMSLTHFPAEVCKVAGIGTAFLLNFYVNLTVVFRDRSPPAASESPPPRV